MPQKQKAAIVVLAMAGVLALGLGIWRTGVNIKKPFLLKASSILTAKEDTWLDLQEKDTDKDGLSDYDETYMYNTSPYIDDTDSDGKKDKDEVESGTDPNCPEGTECQGTTAKSSASVGFDVPNSPLENGTEETIVDLENLSVSQIRELLRASGIDEATLSQLDDKALMDIYKNALKASQ